MMSVGGGVQIRHTKNQLMQSVVRWTTYLSQELSVDATTLFLKHLLPLKTLVVVLFAGMTLTGVSCRSFTLLLEKKPVSDSDS
jgi:hypothetical protein